MAEKKTVQAIVVGGEASAGPPLGPALGPLGVNVMAIVNEINAKTRDYLGMRVPVRINVDTENKSFDVEVGIPTTSALIAKEGKVQKGSGKPNAEFVGSLSRELVVKIAKSKMQQSYASDLKSVVKEIIGSCVSMGVKIEDADPRVVFEDVNKGKWDKLLSS